jgi:hypothetical protein
MFQTFSTFMVKTILECTNVTKVWTLRMAPIPFGKRLRYYDIRLNGSAESVSVFWLSFDGPSTLTCESECVQGRCGPLRHRTEGRLVFYALWRMRFLRGLTNLFPILQAVTEITGVGHLTHELAPGCARAFGRVCVEETCLSFGLKATLTSQGFPTLPNLSASPPRISRNCL